MTTEQQQSGIEAQKNQPNSASTKFDVFADPKETEKRNDIATLMADSKNMKELADDFKCSKDKPKITSSVQGIDEKGRKFKDIDEPIKNGNVKPTNVSDNKEETVTIDSKVKSIIGNVHIDDNFYIDISTGNIILKKMDGQNVRTLDPNNPENKKRITPDGIQKWVNRYTGTK